MPIWLACAHCSLSRPLYQSDFIMWCLCFKQRIKTITLRYLLQISHNVLWSDSPTRTPPRSIYFSIYPTSCPLFKIPTSLFLFLLSTIGYVTFHHSCPNFTQLWDSQNVAVHCASHFGVTGPGCQCYRELTLQNSDHIWVLLKCLMENRKPP